MSAGFDRRGLAVLASGHACADMAQGAIPALLPFLIDQRGISYGAAGALILVTSVGSSAIQPLFGLGSDRLSLPWLMPLGVFLAGLGIALVGLTSSYPATAGAVALSGLGVASFHPEAARFANQVSGDRRGQGMSWFSLGGNAGFALGPILVTPIVLVLGLHGTLLLAVIPTIVAVVLARELGRLRAVAAEKSAHVARSLAEDDRDEDDWNAFVRLGGVVALRSCVYFGLQAFIPLWFIHHLGTGKAAGNAALTAMLVAGAVGTYSGGRVVDRVGRRRLVVGSTAMTIPALVALVLAPSPLPAGLLTALAGFLIILTFSVTVVMSQEYLPNRLGLASGVSLGLAIGVGGIAAALMGVVADAFGLRTVMWLIVALAVPMVLLARTLPITRAERRAQSAVAPSRAAAAGAPPAPATGSASPHPSG
ncbi:MAG: transporter, family, fosmidomycin resistance protein [Solirubrobacteraceae bacterium]